ncbi:MAG: hypothetical protein CMJ46_16220 [Planctomyces sp.]|nr:hypothetical protein [Planctomyces sp.]
MTFTSEASPLVVVEQNAFLAKYFSESSVFSPEQLSSKDSNESELIELLAPPLFYMWAECLFQCVEILSQCFLALTEFHDHSATIMGHCFGPCPLLVANFDPAMFYPGRNRRKSFFEVFRFFLLSAEKSLVTII